MGECVAVLSSNKLRIKKIKEIIEYSKGTCVICESIAEFINVFTSQNLDFYVLDMLDSNGNMINEYRDFYQFFLKYVPVDMRIVIGNYESNGLIELDNFEDSFIEKLACRTLKGKSYKLISNDKIINLKKQVERYLIEKKFSPKYVGFEFVIVIMCFYLTANSNRVILSKDIYPKLCEEYGKSSYCIERNIRFFLQSNSFLGEFILDGKFSTKRILEMLYRDLRKDVFVQKILHDIDKKD